MLNISSYIREGFYRNTGIEDRNADSIALNELLDMWRSSDKHGARPLKQYTPYLDKMHDGATIEYMTGEQGGTTVRATKIGTKWYKDTNNIPIRKEFLAVRIGMSLLEFDFEPVLI